MLKLRDFLHLPAVDQLMQQLIADGPGVILLAGIEPRPLNALPGESAPGASASAGGAIKPGGLSGIFNIMMQEILLAHPAQQCVVIAAERSLARVPRQLSRRVRFVRAEPPFSYPGQIELAIHDQPGLLVIDRLSDDALPAAFHAAQSGLRVLTQFHTVLRGSAVARQLVDHGLAQDRLAALRWIITCQRMPLLCERCKQPVNSAEDTLQRFSTRYPALAEKAHGLLAAPLPSGKPAQFSRAAGCAHCHGTGYAGDISVFDLFHNDPAAGDIFAQEGPLALEEYVLHLAAGGQLDITDLLQLEDTQLRQLYQMYSSSEKALSESTAQLNRKLLELEASNRVLIQRTEVLMSLQDLGQALITSSDLNELATRICRRAGELCGADRVVLYLRRPGERGADKAEILAERGWNAGITGHRLDGQQIFGHGAAGPGLQSARYVQVPPGFRTELPGKDSGPGAIKTGMRVPLVAQEQLVGVMIVQSTQKEFFNQGQSALLQTFANQAALAIQRAGLVDELRAKIDALEAAQVELVQKERLERELELARQVQQSMLPHTFPAIPGYDLAAKNEPARQVGGDFYDIIVLDDNHFGLVIADVADKGLPAALYMALTRSLLLAEARRTRSPREALASVNRLLQELGELNGFVSVFYGVIDCEARRLTYARAGHERPLVLRAGQVSQLGGDGIVLGIVPDDQFLLAEEALDLQPGDLLVLYTDGLTDVLDAAGHFSGLAALYDLLLGNAGQDADALCQSVFSSLAEYRGVTEQFDDMTLLAMKVGASA